jgi:hypothetical protein
MDANTIQEATPVILVIMSIIGIIGMKSVMSWKAIIITVVVVGFAVMWLVNNTELSILAIFEAQGVSAPKGGGISEIEKALDNPFMSR